MTQNFIKSLPGIKWSKEHSMAYLPNTKENLQLVIDTFKGVAWLDGKYFFVNKPLPKPLPKKKQFSIQQIRERKLDSSFKPCPEAYFEKLELKKYAINTAKTYISLFESFINH